MCVALPACVAIASSYLDRQSLPVAIAEIQLDIPAPTPDS
jgi:hypothetical protein